MDTATRWTGLPVVLPAGKALTCAAVTLLGLGACTVGPDFHRPAPEAAAQWSEWHGGDAELALPAAESGAALPADPWPGFDDPELIRLIERARATNQDLRIALLHLAEARVQESTVSAQRGVQVDARLDATRRRDSEYGASTRIVDVIGGQESNAIRQALGEPYSLYRPGFDASWELDLWGRQSRTEESAHASSTEQAAALRQAQLTVAADVARNYFTLRANQRQLELLREEVAMADDEVALLAAQHRGGQIDESAVIRAREQAEDLRALSPSLVSAEAQALNQLTELVGARPGDLNAELMTPARHDEPIGLPTLRAGLPSELARHRPDIAAAEARLHAATANVGVAVAALYPSISLGAAFGLESVGTGNLGNWAARSWYVGPSLSIPVFDHGRRTATITLRELQQQEAAVAYQQTVLRAWHEVDDSISAYRADALRCGALAAKVRQAEGEAELATARRAKGLTSELPRIDARAALSRAQRDLAQCQSQQAVALVALYKALGDDGRDAPADGGGAGTEQSARLESVR